MPCEKCNVKFGIITRKKSCYECHRLFCRNCLSKRQERFLCPNCTIFTRRPLSRIDLSQLKVKDLIFYLQSKHISTSGCVEKDDLINLVIAHVNSGGSSPRTPGSFSAASSNAESASGGSSRYGSFYRNGTKNYTNTFDQIKSTCQNLFSNISDKFNADGSEDVRPTAPPEADMHHHIFTQPRFGSNNVYHSVNPNGTNIFHENTADGDGSQRVPSGQNSQPAHDSSASSGTTSGADSSAASSSFSSPSREAPSPHEASQGPTGAQLQAQASLDDRIENILALEASGTGCECCSDDEDEDRNMRSPEANGPPPEETSDDDVPQRSKLSRRSLSHSNLFPPEQAGPSVDVSAATPRVASRSQTPSSSFDDLLADAEGTSSSNADQAIAPLGTMTETDAVNTTIASLNDTEQWQVINTSDANDSGTLEAAIGVSDLPITDTTNETMTLTINEAGPSSDSISNSVEIKPKPPLVLPVPCIGDRIEAGATVIGRRRSDSYLLADYTNTLRPVGPTGLLADRMAQIGGPSGDTNASSSHAGSHGMCFRCGKRRSGIRRQLKKFRKQLETASGSEADKQRQLETFLSYLERRSKGSFELTDSESITEEASVSWTDEASGGLASALDSHNGPTGDVGGLRNQSYPQPSDETTICTNIYSSGNQELINMKQIKLSDIRESADLDVLSVKQLKAILMVNRVDFKGCCEKAELRERVLRLWRDFKSIPSIEKLPSDDLCKICMDAPIECVILECGHMTTCTACGKVLSECPICRQYIVRVVRFFRA
ncbi:serine-rich adhesin for platelets [Anopheles nili]|uniref:serine-rich adhesin for platelets n=1 Tax=Anopheles nili TaxID=185578 RepID=UPI00237BCF01|nr:serine-rich adhesin for platelets [Anopheles nili]